MKKVLPLLIACALLLVGCKNTEGFLDVPASPSAAISEFPDIVSESVSEETSAETSESVLHERNMVFLETETEHLLQIKTRKGDLEVLGITYGDGVYFVLSRRESGNAVTGYSTVGKGLFAGVLEKAFTSPQLLGYANGYACLYSPDAKRTFACEPDSTYAWFDRKDAETVFLYQNGYAVVANGTLSLYGPKSKEPYNSYPIPGQATVLAADEERALLQQNGTLIQLDAKTAQTATLSPYLSYENGALSACLHGQTAICSIYDMTVTASNGLVRVLAAGRGYLVEELSASVRFTLTDRNRSFVLPKDDTFRFGARTDGGFVFAQGETWYLLSDEAFTEPSPAVLTCTDGTQLLYTAGQALCASASGNIRLAESGAPFAMSPAVAGFTATRVTDGETLFAAASYLLSATQNISLSQNICIYLCDSVTDGAEPALYTMFEDGTVTGVLLDVTDTDYQEQLTEIFSILQEGLTG